MRNMKIQSVEHNYKTAYGNQSHNFETLGGVKKLGRNEEEWSHPGRRHKRGFSREWNDWDKPYKWTGSQRMLLVEKVLPGWGNCEGKIRGSISKKWFGT